MSVIVDQKTRRPEDQEDQKTKKTRRSEDHGLTAEDAEGRRGLRELPIHLEPGDGHTAVLNCTKFWFPLRTSASSAVKDLLVLFSGFVFWLCFLVFVSLILFSDFVSASLGLVLRLTDLDSTSSARHRSRR